MPESFPLPSMSLEKWTEHIESIDLSAFLMDSDDLEGTSQKSSGDADVVAEDEAPLYGWEDGVPIDAKEAVEAEQERLEDMICTEIKKNVPPV